MPGPGGHGGPGGPGGHRGGPGGPGGGHRGPGGPGHGPGGPRGGYGRGPMQPPPPPHHGWGMGHRPYRRGFGCSGCLMPVLGVVAVIIFMFSLII